MFTCVAAQEQVAKGGLLIDSVRSFGGTLSECEFWVVEADSANAFCDSLDRAGVRILELEVRDSIESYLFARKVSACATVESVAKGEARTIVWLIPECLIVRPPRLFVLDGAVRAAVRPVHIVNVGSPVEEEPDAFSRGVYDTTGVPGEDRGVRSFIEDRAIRPYYNSAAMSLDPDAGGETRDAS